MLLPSNLARRASHLATLLSCLLLTTGCQNFQTGSSTVRLRVIDLSADAGALDVYRGGHGVAFNLDYGSVTSYVAVRPGVAGTIVAHAGSHQTLSAANATLLPGSQYTLLVSSPLASLQQTLLTDQPPTSSPSIRLVHQAERTGPVDVYLVPAGHRLASLTPIAINLAPGAVTSYLPVSEGICAAIILPAGTHPSTGTAALHTGRRMEYLHGAAHTLILLDASPTLAHGLDVIETLDTEAVD